MEQVIFEKTRNWRKLPSTFINIPELLKQKGTQMWQNIYWQENLKPFLCSLSKNWI